MTPRKASFTLRYTSSSSSVVILTSKRRNNCASHPGLFFPFDKVHLAHLKFVMDSPSQKSKNTLQNWVKALFHFSMFFTTGFIIACVPPNTTISTLSNHFSINYQLLYPSGKSTISDGEYASTKRYNSTDLVIIVTTTRSSDKFEPIALTRLAHSLATVRPPLLWIVVEAQKKSKLTAERLRSTKLMYRHLTNKENFALPGAEMDHQRNLALRHIVLHRLAGIVNFADASVIL